MKRAYTTIFTFIWISLINGCAPPQPHPATLAYQELVTHLSRGSVEGVWSTLSVKSQAVLLDKVGDKVGEAKKVDEPPSSLAVELDWAFESPFVGQATPVKVHQGETSRILHLQTFYASQPWIIPVILEEGKWRVHLLGARQKSP